MSEQQRHEHRFPRKARSSWPACWVLWYSWRRVVLFTPKVRLRALQIVVTTLPTSSWLLGAYLYRDEDDEMILLLGLGVIEAEVHVMRFLSDAEVEARYGV
jgi:hypothetical protein